LLFVFAAAVQCVASKERLKQYHNGWPSRTGDVDIRSGFVHPPSGYGNVPFYWWSGDSLNLDRLQEQLDMLADASTSGLNVSYCHRRADVDTLIAPQTRGKYGRAQGGAPEVLSEEWWKMWNAFSARCAAKGIGLGMDDYVVAWPGSGYFIDSVLALPGIADYQGKLRMVTMPRGGVRPGNVVSEVQKPGTDSVWVVYSEPSPELSPIFGKKMVEYYFRQFVNHMDAQGVAGMNYFFQDELVYDLHLQSWSEDMRTEFQRRKGYDILPWLPALFVDMGEGRTQRVRLDYAQVLTEMAAERYFRPIYDWCNERGLIYGSDNEGRGLSPTQYLDYFQSGQWFTAPGNDAPARGSSFTQTKVSSSIAHLYQRPRTWLEAFHSMGWDANGALLTHQLDHHIIAGGNLLCMHGLYYSTHGGWWEWAPPSFHFRMPYWPHMKVWLKYAERLCFLMSQGVHVADVAILYPTESMQAYPGWGPGEVFKVGRYLSAHGQDYDYINYTHLQEAQVENGSLSVAGEHYRVLVLPSVRAMHGETWEKTREFARKGGIVIAIDATMPEVLANEDIVKAETVERVLGTLRDSLHAKGLQPDFRSAGDEGSVLHRRIGDKDVYMVMDVERGDELFFRSTGSVEVWDARHGTMAEVKPLRQTEEGTWIRHEADKDVSRLYVFGALPGHSGNHPAAQSPELFVPKHEVDLNSEWEMTIVPTLDNKWGDFRLPATPERIGVEAREMECTFGNEAYSAASVYGYGPHMQVSVNGGTWQDYCFSWQYGVFDNPGGQGYHGLKAKVDHRFLILDKAGRMQFRTRVLAPHTGRFELLAEGVCPDEIEIDGRKTQVGAVDLAEGWHELRITYLNTREGNCTLSDLRYATDKRKRSMVVLYPENAPRPVPYGEYAPIVASKWFGTPHLEYDIHGGEEALWRYRFATAPGTRKLRFRVNGRIESLVVDGHSVKVDKKGVARVKNVNAHTGEAVLTARPAAGFPGAAFFQEPVKITCRKGGCTPGDWALLGAMKYYSGGVRYAKDVRLELAKGRRVWIDLGEVDATCEVAVNGKRVDVLTGKPYRLDISEYVRNGKNHVEVLVYSSLSGHYQSIPSPYKGTPHAGLIGPVKILQ